MALTDDWQGIKLGNLDKAPYIPSNDTYDVTNFIKGPLYDVLKSLEATLNFTTKIYKRRLGGWGIPKIYPNKSVEVSPGMVKDLMQGSADIIVTTLTILYREVISASLNFSCEIIFALKTQIGCEKKKKKE